MSKEKFLDEAVDEIMDVLHMLAISGCTPSPHFDSRFDLDFKGLDPETLLLIGC